MARYDELRAGSWFSASYPESRGRRGASPCCSSLGCLGGSLRIPGGAPCPKFERPAPGSGHILWPMKQSVSLITLGVADYERAKAFYEAIGWSPRMDIEETAFFQANGVVLVLWS